MPGQIQKELKQTKPLMNLGEEAFLNIMKAADVLMTEMAALLKPAGLTPTQYNVLRILRGAHPDTRSCGQIAERMITRDPDITRLLDRLESRKLIERQRDVNDRRHVTTRITDEGLAILKGLDEPVGNLHRRQMSRLNTRQLQELISLLEMAREVES